MIAIRLVPIAAIAVLGVTMSAAAQMTGTPTPMPGQAPPQQQLLPCFADFKPLRDEAEKRGLALKTAIQKKISREEACTLIKAYAVAEAKVVKFIQTNADWCGIPATAASSMQANHIRTQQSEKQVCTGGGLRVPGQRWAQARGAKLNRLLRHVVEPRSDTSTNSLMVRKS